MKKMIILLLSAFSLEVLASGVCICKGTASVESKADNYLSVATSEDLECEGYGCCIAKNQKREVYFSESLSPKIRFIEYMSKSGEALSSRPIGSSFKYVYSCKEAEGEGKATWLVE